MTIDFHGVCTLDRTEPACYAEIKSDTMIRERLLLEVR